jgi:ribosomal protein L17
MEVHTTPAAAKRTRSYLHTVFFMARKGVLSNKRKLFISMHLLMKWHNRSVASLL